MLTNNGKPHICNTPQVTKGSRESAAICPACLLGVDSSDDINNCIVIGDNQTATESYTLALGDFRYKMTPEEYKTIHSAIISMVKTIRFELLDELAVHNIISHFDLEDYKSKY